MPMQFFFQFDYMWLHTCTLAYAHWIYQPFDGEDTLVSSIGAEAVLNAVDSLIEKIATSSTTLKNTTFEKPNICKYVCTIQHDQIALV